MCGILGWFGGRDAAAGERFDTALDLLAHRGPDDRGVYQEPGAVLGMRRLAIIDTTLAGHQPMVEGKSGSVLIFNGEIYNHVELREELEQLGHRFKGRSDSEVLLHALTEWDEGALPRLNGMWAFAFWQPKNRRLLLSRDRFGVKPLYYRDGSDGFGFASEPKALLSLFPRHREVASNVLLAFLGSNALPMAGESFYRGIYALPPAHLAIYSPDSRALCLKRFWGYPTEVDDEISQEEAVEAFDELFEDAVRLRLRSDVPVGLTLSGGLDSSSILAAASGRATAPLTCFTSVYDNREAGEFKWARQAAEAAAASLQAVLAPQEDWLPTMRAIAWHMDGPGYSPAVYPLWQIMRTARAAGVPVLLEGQGADEALAGYTQYAAAELLHVLSGRSPEQRTLTGVARHIWSLQATFSLRWLAAWMVRETVPPLLDLHRRRVGFQSLLRDGIVLPEKCAPRQKSSGDPVSVRLRDDHARNILPGLLHYGDAISMAHSVEARQPFLDYRLVEMMFRLPMRHKLRDGETKWILRRYLQTHGQQSIGSRRDKQGYPTSIRSWLAFDGGESVERLLLGRPSMLHEWCEPAKIKRLLARGRNGAMAADHHIYKLVSTQIWLNECIECPVAQAHVA